MHGKPWLGTSLAIGCFLSAAGSCAASPLPASVQQLRDRAAGYEMTVLVDGAPIATYDHAGGTYVLGQLGARYTLRVANHSGRRVEAVVSVDGRDVIDGRPADFRSKRGYLIPAWGSVDIDGWRISQSEAAAFRFSSVPDSYAARTGSAREVGVIGVAIFPERYIPPVVVPRRPYAIPEGHGGWRGEWRGRSGDADRGPADDLSERSAAPAPPASTGAPKGLGGSRQSAPAESATDNPLEADEAPLAKRSRPGLGTEYGEAVSSPIYQVEFVRANAGRPAALLGAHYDDHDGLVAMGIPVDGDPCRSEADLRLSAEPFPAAERTYAAPPPGWRPSCDSR